jgi:hypothetical protein
LRRDVKLTTNQLKNIIGVSKYLPDHVRQIKLHLNNKPGSGLDKFTIILINEEMADQVRIMLQTMPSEMPITLGIDTTYELGPCFATVVNSRNPIFEKSKLGNHQTDSRANMPIAVMLHERRYQDDHQDFFTQIHKTKCKSFVDAVKKQQTNKKLPDPTESILYDEYTATCHCNRPDVKNKETIRCSSCKTLTHKKCIVEEDHIFHIMCGGYKFAPCTVNKTKANISKAE